MGKKDRKRDASKDASKGKGAAKRADERDDERPRIKARRRPAGADRFRDEPKEIAVFDPENVERVLDAMPSADRVLRAADRLGGLAHPSRVQAVCALAASELCVGDVAAVLGLSLSATSTMLKQLRGLGWLAVRHAGKQTYYRLSSSLPKAVLDLLFKLDEAPV
ncbi:MAG: winged helix-turn-helix transcriptional regulator [Deltaproteobacteria bacterium]|nr:winged helix-turn-helix transcriptional regulator [Deltaproteobacteria bacterium]